MLQLPAATGAGPVPVRPARPGELRVWVASPAQPRPSLLADLIRRIAERHHLQASVSQPGPAGWDALNVHPAQIRAAPPDPLDVAVCGPGRPAVAAAHQVRPGLVQPELPDTAGLDPLALRLALLEYPYRAEVLLGRDDLEAAQTALADLRARVAHWAASPSRPLCAQYAGDFLGALDADLDTPAALGALAALAADPDVADGAKFESFAYLDRFLGLDLARDVGR